MPIKEEVLNVFRQMVEEEGDNQAKAAARERAAVYKKMVDKLMGRDANKDAREEPEKIPRNSNQVDSRPAFFRRAIFLKKSF